MREFARRVRIARRVCSNRELVRTRTPHEQARRTARKAVEEDVVDFKEVEFAETGRNRGTTSLISARSWLSGETGRVCYVMLCYSTLTHHHTTVAIKDRAPVGQVEVVALEDDFVAQIVATW